MDNAEHIEAEFPAREADIALALREYVWFSIILLCLVVVIAVKTHR
jgi:hypothetical protein